MPECFPLPRVVANCRALAPFDCPVVGVKPCFVPDALRCEVVPVFDGNAAQPAVVEPACVFPVPLLPCPAVEVWAAGAFWCSSGTPPFSATAAVPAPPTRTAA